TRSQHLFSYSLILSTALRHYCPATGRLSTKHTCRSGLNQNHITRGNLVAGLLPLLSFKPSRRVTRFRVFLPLFHRWSFCLLQIRTLPAQIDYLLPSFDAIGANSGILRL